MLVYVLIYLRDSQLDYYLFDQEVSFMIGEPIRSCYIFAKTELIILMKSANNNAMYTDWLTFTNDYENKQKPFIRETQCLTHSILARHNIVLIWTPSHICITENG